jgi:hypothetical protein
VQFLSLKTIKKRNKHWSHRFRPDTCPHWNTHVYCNTGNSQLWMHAHCQSSFILGAKRGVCGCNKIMLKRGQNSICLSQEAHPVTRVSHWPSLPAPTDHKLVSQQGTPKYTAMAAVHCHSKTSTALVCLFICLMSIHCMQN